MEQNETTPVKPMSLAMVLFRYFPHGGMQSNFLRIAQACMARGHAVDVYTLDWQGERPQGMNIHVLEVQGRQNIRRYEAFSVRINEIMQQQSHDLIIGFNRMPGLDLYYAADPCFVERVRQTRPWYYPLSARYRHFKAFETALFQPTSQTRILALTEAQIADYQHHYATQSERFRLLPPSVRPAYRRDDAASSQRQEMRQRLGISGQTRLVLMVGSGFERKGFDRGLRAVAALPEDIRHQCHILVVGKGREKPLRRLAGRLGLASQFTLLPASDEVPEMMQAADLMLHPARSESAGAIIVEAIAGGLPVICSGACGYAFHLNQAQAGQVLDEPFDSLQLNETLSNALQSSQLKQWSENALQYANREDLYSRIEVAVLEIEAMLH